MNENQIKSINGQISKKSLLCLLQELQANGTIAYCSSDYRNGYSEVNPSQFYASFYVEFLNGEGWLLFSTNSVRNDRINIQQWNSFHLRRIGKHITHAFVVVPDEIEQNLKEREFARKYHEKIISQKIYTSIDGVYLQGQIYNKIVEKANGCKASEAKKEAVLPSINESDKYISYLPLYSLRAACGKFGASENCEEEGWLRVEKPLSIGKNMFVVRAGGHSMEPKIKDNDLCIFRSDVVGTCENKIVLIQHHQHDCYDGSYSIKIYHETVDVDPQTGEWKQKKIWLEPINKTFSNIELRPEPDAFSIVGEFVCVL